MIRPEMKILLPTIITQMGRNVLTGERAAGVKIRVNGFTVTFSCDGMASQKIDLVSEEEIDFLRSVARKNGVNVS